MNYFLNAPVPVAAAKTSGLAGDQRTWKTEEWETLMESSGSELSSEWRWTSPSAPACTNRFLEVRVQIPGHWRPVQFTQ